MTQILPIIETPFNHSMILPDKVNVNFKPFVGRQEKVLLLALESEDPRTIASSVLKVVEDCVEGNYNFGDKPLYFTEYALLQIRSKSVSEQAEISYPCSKCEKTIETVANFDKVKFTQDYRTDKTMITVADNVNIELKELTFKDIINQPQLLELKNASQYYDIVEMLIDKVYTNDDVMIFNTVPKEQQTTFVESLSSISHNEIKQFITDTPTCYIDVNDTCGSCGHLNIKKIEGLSNFFQ